MFAPEERSRGVERAAAARWSHATVRRLTSAPPLRESDREEIIAAAMALPLLDDQPARKRVAQ